MTLTLRSALSTGWEFIALDVILPAAFLYLLKQGRGRRIHKASWRIGPILRIVRSVSHFQPRKDYEFNGHDTILSLQILGLSNRIPQPQFISFLAASQRAADGIAFRRRWIVIAPTFYVYLTGMYCYFHDGIGGISKLMLLGPPCLFISLMGIVYGRKEIEYYELARRCEMPFTAVLNCANAVRACAAVQLGRISFLDLDNAVRQLDDDLAILQSGIPVVAILRNSEIADHIAKVRRVLHGRSGDVVKDGVTALPELAEALTEVMDRMIEGRWLGLLAPDALIGVEIDPPEPVSDRSRRDTLLVVAGSIIGPSTLLLASVVGMPSAAVTSLAAVLTLAPAAMWGSRRLAVDNRTLVSATGISTAGSQETVSPEQST